MVFLKQEVECEDRLLLSRSSFAKNDEKEKEKSRGRWIPTAATLIAGDVSDCLFCDKSSHKSQDCFRARELTLQERRDRVAQKKRCFQCLKAGHPARLCRSFVKCFICYRRHLTVMCPEEKEKKTVEDKEKKCENEGTYLAQNNFSEVTLLQTLLVRVRGPKSSLVVRALIDSGSQKSYIKKECAEQLKLTKFKTVNFSHSLFGGVETEQLSHNIYKVKLQNLKAEFSCEVQLLDQDKICGGIPRLNDEKYLEILKKKGIILTDKGKNDLEVQLLLGADLLPQILTGKTERIDSNLIAIETKLGWTVMGKSMRRCENVLINLLNGEKLPELWRLEILGIEDPATKKSQKIEGEEVLQHFEQSVTNADDGRYVVKLPWVEGHQPIETNRALAEKRLVSLTKRLRANGYFNDYQKVFQEWKEAGIIREIEDEDSGHYLPHHVIIKNQSLTTKVRPVFDASARDKNGNSLNACLFKGDNFIELIPSLILKFRKEDIGVCADIEKAFLQISLKESDRKFMKFLWWENYEENKMKVYQHNRVVFGVTCSPFLLGAVLRKHLSDAPEEFQEVVQRLKHSFYVDNLITSVSEKVELMELIEKAKILLSTACFNLRDWQFSESGKDGDVSVLGLIWDKGEKDSLRCAPVTEIVSSTLTKRKLLSATQKIFDPIGHTCPATIIPKLLLQESWNLKLDWEKIGRFTTVKRIKWKFNPPTAAWWGGWWERLVRSIKVLRRNLGNSVVTYDELQTLLCDCEAIINSRPLTFS